MKITNENRELPYQCPRCGATGPITSKPDSLKDQYNCSFCLIDFKGDGTIVAIPGQRN